MLITCTYKCTTRLVGSPAALCPITNCISATLEVCLAKTGKTHKINILKSSVLFSEYLYKPLKQRRKKGHFTCCFGHQVSSLKMQYKKADALSCCAGERTTNELPKLFKMINGSFRNK